MHLFDSKSLISRILYLFVFISDFDLKCDNHGGFTCWNGFCIDVEGVCDGVLDCLDQSDEIECGESMQYKVCLLTVTHQGVGLWT